MSGFQKFLAALLRYSIKILAILPLRCLYLLSDFLFLLVYFVFRYRRKVVADNLQKAFPEKSPAERLAIQRKFYRFFCDLFIETIKLFHISKKQISKRIHFSDNALKTLADLHSRGKQIFGPIGHFANWEWLAALAPDTDYHAASLYRPLNNKPFNALMETIRTQFGAQLIPEKYALRYIHKIQTEGKLSHISFLSDQSPEWDKVQYWTSFFGNETPMFTGIDKLAHKYNTAVVYYEISRVSRGHYVVDTKVITENAADCPPHQITDAHVALLEQSIRKNPHLWLWTHRRWKHDRAEVEAALKERFPKKHIPK